MIFDIVEFLKNEITMLCNSKMLYKVEKLYSCL